MILWRISNKELVNDKIFLDRNLPAQDDPEEQERGRKRNVSSSNLNGAIPGPSKMKRSLSPPNITDLAGSKVAAAEAEDAGLKQGSKPDSFIEEIKKYLSILWFISLLNRSF